MTYDATHNARIKDIKCAVTNVKSITDTLNERTSGLTLDQASIHNTIAGGRDLGTFTAEHLANIKNGSYKDMYLGDYFTHNGKQDIIVGFRYPFTIYSSGAACIILQRWTPFRDDTRFVASYNRAANGDDPGTIGKFYHESNWYTVVRPYFIEEIESIYGASNVQTLYIDVPTGWSGTTPSGWVQLASKAHLPTRDMVGAHSFLYPTVSATSDG